MRARVARFFMLFRLNAFTYAHVLRELNKYLYNSIKLLDVRTIYII